MSVLSQPLPHEHIAPCGLFCTACGMFKRGRCKGCQIEAGFKRCSVRICCERKRITVCAQCPEFAAPRDFRECRKVHHPIARVIGFFTRSDRPGALALLRDRGRAAYLASRGRTGPRA